ncbi:phosphoribosylaminoimidazolesuccinocarboxamide synthase [candidate division WOR-3 bacterium]|nr:phosphoribosylaminoimidazolesuccinocarboxamide synthase [candidate division WOR-3 bacterium]
MGSVKDLEVIKKPTESESGIGRFQFSDRYSVFDWGAMPDEIPKKGASLAIMTSYFFELLGRKGINTHYRGIVKDGKVIHLDEVKEPFNKIEVDLVRVFEPGRSGKRYDYSIYEEIDKNYLIPLEFIYRNSIPKGSSFWERYHSGLIVDVPENLKPDTNLTKSILDVSTKLEETDRYLSWKEAKEIAHLCETRIEEIKEILLTVNNLITEAVKISGITNQDGKLELGIDSSGSLIVVDAIGTLDECRFLFDEIALSKEILRKYYRKTKWFKEVLKAKEKSKRDWKILVQLEPPTLPESLKDIVSQIYQSVANTISKKEFFTTPPLKEVVKEISKVI